MEHINLFIVFIEGILSIFSPCILPILPMYLSMLSNSSIDEIKNTEFKNTVLIKNTIFFTLGISTTFFILGSSINALGSFFINNKSLIMIIGGIIILIMGFFYLGIIKSELLSREKRISFKYKSISSLGAFVLGFTFSFGWTPCIGPILSSVLVMASTSGSLLTANILISIYTIGFILPFILASLFYSKIYKKFDNIKKYMGQIKKIGGILIIIAGILMIFNGFKTYNSEISIRNDSKIESNDTTHKDNDKNTNKIEPIDFTLYDQFGNEHTLSEYKGKTVFLNFWATWCGPCRAEMSDINQLYEEYNKNNGDVVILGVASPKLGREGTEEDIKKFLEEENYQFPVVFDDGGSMFINYGMNAFPSTLIIDKEGYIIKYIPGAMNKDAMKKIIEE